MNMKFDFGTVKGNFWINELPDIGILNESFVEKELDIDFLNDIDLKGTIKSAIEIRIPKGGITNYGLLGIELGNKDNKNFYLSLPVFNEAVKIEIKRPYMQYLEKFYYYSNKDDLDFIEKVVYDYHQNVTTKYNLLRISQIVSGHISSSPLLFGKLTKLLLTISYMENKLEKDCIDIIKQNIY